MMISIFWWVEVLRTNKINMAPNLRHLKIEFLNNIKYIIGKIFTVLYNFSKVRPPRKTLICNIHIRQKGLVEIIAMHWRTQDKGFPHHHHFRVSLVGSKNYLSVVMLELDIYFESSATRVFG